MSRENLGELSNPEIGSDIRLPIQIKTAEDIKRLLRALRRMAHDQSLGFGTSVPEAPGFYLMKGATPSYYHLLGVREGGCCGEWHDPQEPCRRTNREAIRDLRIMVRGTPID